MNNNFFKAGSWNVCCDRCGRKYKRDQCQKEWTGLLVCSTCYEPRHPITRPLPAVVDSRGVRDARPRPATVYVDPVESLSVWGVSYETSQGIDANAGWTSISITWNGGSDTTDFIYGDN